jgi:hypothetical protein
MANSRYRRYSRNLSGFNAQGFFGRYGADDANTLGYTTLDLLAAEAHANNDATNGVVGVYDEAGAIIAAPLTDGDQFRIAQILDGQLKLSTAHVWGTGGLNASGVVKTAYVAPVLQQEAVGYNGTTGSLNITLVAGQRQEFAIAARDLTPASQPFPVQEARVVKTLDATTQFAIANALAIEFNGDYDFEQNYDDIFAHATVITDIATQAANGALTLAVLQNSDAVTFSGAHGYTGGEYIAILGHLFLVDQIISATVVKLSRKWRGATQTALATGNLITTWGDITYVDGTTDIGIRVTAEAEDVHFNLSVGEDLAGADYSVIQAWLLGSGAPWQLRYLEEETQTFHGWTTKNYPFVEDFGKPTSFVSADDDSAQQWAQWFLTYRNGTRSMAYANENTHHLGNIVVAAESQGALETYLDTVFGT